MKYKNTIQRKVHILFFISLLMFSINALAQQTFPTAGCFYRIKNYDSGNTYLGGNVAGNNNVKLEGATTNPAYHTFLVTGDNTNGFNLVNFTLNLFVAHSVGNDSTMAYSGGAVNPLFKLEGKTSYFNIWKSTSTTQGIGANASTSGSICYSNKGDAKLNRWVFEAVVDSFQNVLTRTIAKATALKNANAGGVGVADLQAAIATATGFTTAGGWTTSVSGSEILTAVSDLKVAMKTFVQNNASGSNPLDISFWGTNLDMELCANSAMYGWTVAADYGTWGAKLGLPAGNLSGRAMEIWNSNLQGKTRSATQTLTNLPNGFYTMQAAAWAVDQRGGTYTQSGTVQLFAGTNTANVPVQSPKPADNTVLAGAVLYTIQDIMVTDGTLSIGLRDNQSNGNWIGFDNVKLFYKGSLLAPYISTSKTQVSFKGNGQPVTDSIIVSGFNLTGPISISAPAGITVNPTTLAANASNTKVYVTYNGTTAINGNIAFTSGSVANNVAVSGTLRNPNFYIYICFGQSNMEGQGAIEAQDRTVDSRFKVLQSLDCTSTSRTKGNWYPALPPLCLCDKGLTPADYFGRTMVQYLPDSITIGVINVSVGGCDIRLFDKDLYQNYVAVPNESWFTDKIKVYNGNPRKHLMDLARLAQQDGVIKGMLMHQGEANLGDTNWPQYVKKVYNDMLNELSLGADTVPLLSGEVLYSGIYRDMNTIVRQLPNTIPTAHIISAAGCGAMDVAHFNSEGYRIIGKRYAAKMLSLMGISVDEAALGIALKEPVNPGTSNLTHQWTFDDGTANDAVGTANGTLMGGATIVDGVLKTDASGQYLELPASQLGLTTYPALSFETWFKSKSGANTGNTMLSYIGDTYSGKGSNGFFLSVARTDNTSRVSISCGNTTSPWSAESYAGSAEFDDGLLHQAVGVISSSNITYYVDGIKQTTSALSVSNSLANIKLNYAYLAKSGYTGDPTWLGTVDKFSLYNKALSDEEVLYLYRGGSYVSTALSIPTQSTVSIYPSVAKDLICFKSANMIPDGFFKLLSPTGQQVYSRHITNSQQGQFDISAIPSGMYVAQIAGNKTTTSTLVVKK